MILDQVAKKWTEEERLAALDGYGILDTPPDKASACRA
jgi:hypothetical protein